MFTKKTHLLKHPLTILLLLLLAALPAACNNAPSATPNDSPTPAADATSTAPALMPAATVEPVEPTTAAPTTAAYPDPAEEAAAPTSDAYPVPPSPVPTIDPYPGGLIWIIRPVGIQCEPESPVGYGTLNEAVATLYSAGISVLTSETVELPVTTACGSPTSEHYRVQIGADHLPAAEEMGWVAEE